MPDTFPAASLETAACLWEAVLERRDDPLIHSAFERLGTSSIRLTVLNWVQLVDAAWAKARDTHDAPFDWEFVPQWISANIDWTTDYPTYKLRGRA